MPDFSEQITELQGCKQQFDTFGERLFDLHPDVTEEEFPIQEMFALAAKIIYVRYRVACIIPQIQDKMEEEGGMDFETTIELMSAVYTAFDFDNDMPGILIEEIVEFKTNKLALSFSARYQDILLSVVKYCQTGDSKWLQKRFREISVKDILN